MILAVDIGTTILKAGLIDNSGNLLKVSRQLIASSGVTCNPRIWTSAFENAVKELDFNSSDLECLIISGNGPTLAPSQSGDALLWTHSAEEESAEILKKTGLRLGPTMFLPKALYIKNHQKDVYDSNKYFLSSPEYLSYCLTGVAKTVMPLEGLEKWYWNEDILKTLDLDSSKFPPFIKSGKLLGKVNTSAALRFGLKEGTPVLSGCPDFVSAIIGSGAMHQGQICNRSGTGEGINYCSATFEENPSYMCYRHPNGKDWNISKVIPDTGSAVDRLKGSMGYTEFFHSEKGRTLCTDICLRIKNAIEEIAKGPVTEVRLTGGPSKSEEFNQMRADICNIKFVTLSTPEAGLSGLGIIALASLEKTDIATIAAKVVKIKKEYLPTE